MPSFCSVLNCDQKGFKDKDGNKVTYHNVPTNVILRRKWFGLMRRRDFYYNDKKHIRVCSKHFKPTDFRICISSGYTALKKDVVPSQFSWNYNTVSHVGSDKIALSTLEVNNSIEAGSSSNTSAKHPLENQDEQEIMYGSINASLSISVPQNLAIENQDQLEPVTTNININTASLCSLKNENQQLTHEISQLKTKLKDSNMAITEKEKKLNDIEKKFEDENLQNSCLSSKIQELKLKIALLNLKLKNGNEKQHSYLSEIKRQNKLVKCFQSQIKELDKKSISLEKIKDKDSDVHFYTGLPNYQKLMALYNFLKPGENGENISFSKTLSTKAVSRPRMLEPEQQFLLVMMRIRLGLFTKDLAHRFGVSSSTVNKICTCWINHMYLKFRQQNIWTSRAKIDATMPETFKALYPTTRVILDAKELKCETQSSLVFQSGTYTNYKSLNTFKGLIGINPLGYVTFVSPLYTGCISDKELIRKSGLLDLKFSQNDSIMADKAFLMSDLLAKTKMRLVVNIPQFLKNNGPFTAIELEEKEKIAELRIHLERRIQSIKSFHIFNRPIPLSLAPIINQLWSVLALLTNFQMGFIQKVSDQILNQDEDEINAELDPPLIII